MDESPVTDIKRRRGKNQVKLQYFYSGALTSCSNLLLSSGLNSVSSSVSPILARTLPFNVLRLKSVESPEEPEDEGSGSMGGGGGTKNGVHVEDIISSTVLLFLTVDVRRAVGLAVTAAAAAPDDRRVAGIPYFSTKRFILTAL